MKAREAAAAAEAVTTAVRKMMMIAREERDMVARVMVARGMVVKGMVERVIVTEQRGLITSACHEKNLEYLFRRHANESCIEIP